MYNKPCNKDFNKYNKIQNSTYYVNAENKNIKSESEGLKYIKPQYKCKKK